MKPLNEWRPGTVLSRAYFIIRAGGVRGVGTNALHAMAGGSMVQLHQRLELLEQACLVRGAGPAGPWVALSPEDPPTAAYTLGVQCTSTSLGERAFTLIALTPSGLDTEQLGAELGATPQEVRQALEGSPHFHELATCHLVRRGVELVLYRLSARGVLPYHWADRARATWDNHKARLGQAFNTADAGAAL